VQFVGSDAAAWISFSLDSQLAASEQVVGGGEKTFLLRFQFSRRRSTSHCVLSLLASCKNRFSIMIVAKVD